MRTTLNLDDTLMLQVKQRAARDQTTITHVIEEALARLLSAPPAPMRQFAVRVFRGAPAFAVDPADEDALEAWLDERKGRP
jgi:hypothetical protein